MPIEFTIDDGKGSGGIVDTNYVADTLRQQGEQVLNVSPDGMMLTLADDHGQFQVPVSDALGKLGVKVANFAPAQANYDTINHGWRAAVHKIPTDDLRRSFLEMQMRNSGMEPGQIIGKGRDWYRFDPATGGYQALTNNPDWDLSDITEGALEVPRMAASAAAGASTVLGTGGLGAVAAPLMAGAAGGGVDLLERGALAAAYPEFRQLAEENAGTFGEDMAFNAGIDALSGGGLRAVGYGAKALGGAERLATASPKLAGALQKTGGFLEGLQTAAPISKTVQAAGKGLESGGHAVRSVAGALDNGFARDMTAAFLPGVGETQMAGWIAGLPQSAAKGLPGAANYLANTQLVQRFAPRLARGLTNYAEEASGKTAAEAMEQLFLHGRQSTMTPQLRLEAYREGRRFGMAPSEAKAFSQGVRSDARTLASGRGSKSPLMTSDTPGGGRLDEAFVREAKDLQPWAKAGRGIGTAIDAVGNAGDMAARGAEKVAGGVLKTAKVAGSAAHHTGAAMRAAGSRLAPYETRSALNRAMDYYGQPYAEESMETALRRRKKSSMLGGDLAQNRH